MKKVLLNLINFFLKTIVKHVIKDKIIMPHRIVDHVFEIFDNLNEKKIFNKKIILPYEDVNILNRINIYRPSEILEVEKILKNSEFNLNLDTTRDLIIPLAILDQNLTQKGNDKIKLFFGDKKVELELKYPNRFHFLPVKSNESIQEVKIQSDRRDIVIGKPIYKDKKQLKGKPKLIVHIFVDALAQSVIEKFGFEIMPNTINFFSKGGKAYTNTYAQSEWTLSSVAGILTGKYTNEHLLYHPRRESKISDITIADALNEEGYITFSCTNIPKLNPVNGFDKGFDRCIVALDKDYNYIINEACEQLDAFGGNQYLFLSFFDLHEAHRLQNISTQAATNLEDFKYKEMSGNSKDTSILYDVERINVYKNSISHFDKKLKRLFSMINDYDKDALVVLHSDHGVNFMTQTNELLGKEREKVVFLYKNNKDSDPDNNIKEIRELPSMLCKDLNIKDRFFYQNDSYAISESLYPNKEYEIAIRDTESVLFFKVKWDDLVRGKIDDCIYKISYRHVDRELEALDIDGNYYRLLNIAKLHYKTMVENFIH